MSLATEYSTREDAKTMTVKQIEAAIQEINESPDWKGHEFEDARVRHKTATRKKTFERILSERLQHDPTKDPNQDIYEWVWI